MYPYKFSEISNLAATLATFISLLATHVQSYFCDADIEGWQVRVF